MTADAPAAAPFTVMALYKFADLSDAGAIRPQLAAFCCARGIRGTLILAPEGINGTVAGTDAAIAALHGYLLADGPFGRRLAGAEIKFSHAREMPFLRMKVRLKSEIVTLRAPHVNPARTVGTYVEPGDWNDLIARDDVVVVDTRNDYEVGLGTFRRALDPRTRTFTAFKDFVSRELDPARDRKIAMFCTGGIRCEKASAYLLAEGFSQVFHLKGGILAYLEQVPAGESRFDGECFVFDERVSVGHGLAQGEASLCRACRHPLTAADRADPAFVEGVSCPHCAAEVEAEAKRSRVAERQRQVELARLRGLAHLGDDAARAARRRKAAKEAAKDAAREAARPACRRRAGS
ncbi:MAG: rhodanese-related sulfurtransferase [Pseudochelatococcus sp.]|uniref:oxygen-dependent tRNA uridine(34) hydroxylase TrhO n=1 Tax=Pseudochelatococcus sp. TaxID=2020869 RepID=UPI003D8AAB9F